MDCGDSSRYFRAQDIRRGMHSGIPGKGRDDLGSSGWRWPIPGMVGSRPPERNACILGCRRSAFLWTGAGTAVGHTGVKISASLTLGGVGSIIAIVMRITPFVPYPEPQGGRLENLRCDLERSIRRQTCGQAWRLGQGSGRGSCSVEHIFGVLSKAGWKVKMFTRPRADRCGAIPDCCLHPQIRVGSFASFGTRHDPSRKEIYQ